MPFQFDTIRRTFANLRREGKARHRDIAAQLHISEGELIAAHAGASVADPASGPESGPILAAVRLRPEWPQLIGALEPLGEVLALTRNESCVHEKTGIYQRASHQQHVGLVLGGAIDLRIFYREWRHGFAVTEYGGKEIQRSLQFFDASGSAIHKVFLKPQSDLAACAALVERFADPHQQPGIEVLALPPKAADLDDTAIDRAGFHAAWASLRDTHDFYALLKRFSLGRLQALRLAEARFVQRIEKECLLDLLNQAALDDVAIMAFVGNRGMIQIHSGPVKKIAVMGPWLNVLDPGFNLHLREDHIASAWVVRKPTVDGLVTSVELFDAAGETILMLFGARKPGNPELCAWRALVDNLLQEHQACAA